MANRGRRGASKLAIPQQARAQDIALAAFDFLATEPRRLSHFLDMSGIGLQSIRAASQEPGFLAGVIAISTAAVFAIGKHSGKYATPAPSPTQTAGQPLSQPSATPTNDNPFNLNTILSGAPPNPAQSPFFDAVQIVIRLLLAVVLSGILAFRPRKNVPLFRRSLFV